MRLKGFPDYKSGLTSKDKLLIEGLVLKTK